MANYWIYLVIYVWVGVYVITTMWYEHERVKGMLIDRLVGDEHFDDEYFEKVDSALYFTLNTSSDTIVWIFIVLMCAAYPISMPIARYKIYKAEKLLRNRPR